MDTTRARWIAHLWQLAGPVLRAGAAGTLHRDLPLRCRAGGETERARFTHLEAIGRTLAGIAPWLEGESADADEARLQAEARGLAVQVVANAVDPAHPDRVNFREGGQPIVDAAFLAHALLRAPRVLLGGLDATTRGHLAAALACTRDRLPANCNWLLFAAMSEAALHRLGVFWDPMRVDHALRSHERWYLGDGVYGDGRFNHCDYYNSYVIQPMLVDILASVPAVHADWTRMREAVAARFTRAAAVQERMIAADGSFPPVGRSLTYRCGAFQTLAQAALQRCLPEGLPPAQARGALDAVIARTLGAAGTYDAAGWLMPGLCGHQGDLMERYISTGSLYLASTAFLPLGLPAADPFWSGPDQPWTQVRVWRGEDVPADHALHDAP